MCCLGGWGGPLLWKAAWRSWPGAWAGIREQEQPRTQEGLGFLGWDEAPDTRDHLPTGSCWGRKVCTGRHRWSSEMTSRWGLSLRGPQRSGQDRAGQGRAGRALTDTQPSPQPQGPSHSLCRIHFQQALRWHMRKEPEPMKTTSTRTTQRSMEPGTERWPCTLHPKAGAPKVHFMVVSREPFPAPGLKTRPWILPSSHPPALPALAPGSPSGGLIVEKRANHS